MLKFYIARPENLNILRDIVKEVMFTPMTLEEMKNIDVRFIDSTTLVDIKSVTINTALPHDERLLDFLEQIKNPYCFMCGKAVVKVGFSDTEATLEDRLERYLMSL